MRAVRGFCDGHGLLLHLDGARLANAAVATGVSLSEYAGLCDTVSVCLSKGLGAPVGSVLAGSSASIREARRARKLLGGGMRQVGILAAAGLFALEHNLERLADDHRRARTLASRLAAIPGLAIDMASVQTNMVFADTRPSGLRAVELVARLADAGVLALDESPWSVRFVTHLDLDDGDVDEAAAIVERALAPPS
jgi:threonine aldolase